MPGGTVNLARTNGFERRTYNVSFAPNGAGQFPVYIVDRGDVVSSIERTGLGVFRVIFQKGVVTNATFMSANAALRLDIASVLRAYAGTISNNADGSWQILVRIVDNAGAAADCAPAADREISLTVEVDEQKVS